MEVLSDSSPLPPSQGPSWSKDSRPWRRSMIVITAGPTADQVEYVPQPLARLQPSMAATLLDCHWQTIVGTSGLQSPEARPVISPSRHRLVSGLPSAHCPLSQPEFFGCRRGQRQGVRLQSPAWSPDSHPDAVPLVPRRRHAVAGPSFALRQAWESTPSEHDRAPSPQDPPCLAAVGPRDCGASEARAVAPKAAEFESGPAVGWVDGCRGRRVAPGCSVVSFGLRRGQGLRTQSVTGSLSTEQRRAGGQDRFSLPGVLINKELAAPAPLAARP